MGFKPSAMQYISWVQRSLNRILGSSLTTDGRMSTTYRDLIRDFQYAYILKSTGVFDRPEQDAVINANHYTFEYIQWFHEALRRVGTGVALNRVGVYDRQSKKAVKSFQSYMGIGDDGWVGPRTETLLILEGGGLPPGTVKASPPPGRPKPPKPLLKPVRPKVYDRLTIRQRTDRVVGSILAEVVSKPSFYPNKLERSRLKCVLFKLRSTFPSDNAYVRSRDARSYVLGKGGFAGGQTVDGIAQNARKDLEHAISLLSMEHRTDKDIIRSEVLYLFREITRGMNQVDDLHSSFGDDNLGSKLIYRWVSDKREKNISILSCFKDV